MINIFKSAYCFYIVQLLLQCKNEEEMNTILDKIIDEDNFDLAIQGDQDIKKVFEYVYKHRKHKRDINVENPMISSKIVAKVMAKSVF
jgi:hypothetical protein